jgi:hypothetical protein
VIFTRPQGAADWPQSTASNQTLYSGGVVFASNGAEEIRGKLQKMRFRKIAAVGALAVLCMGVAIPPQVQAAYVAYLYQDGSNVVATGSGSFDVLGLTAGATETSGQGMNPGFPILTFGTDTEQLYGPVSSPSNFGSNIFFAGATSASGAHVVISKTSIGVPVGYVSGTRLGTSTHIWTSTTLAALGATDGTYEWTWGSGADTDSATLHVGVAPPLPEAASVAFLAAGLVVLGVMRRR